MRASSFGTFVPRLIVPIAGALIALSIARAPARAESSFVIAANDGYGIGDCLATGSACGRIVADAWCQSHGRGRSISFGAAGDVTGSIHQASVSRRPDAIIVTCGD